MFVRNINRESWTRSRSDLSKYFAWRSKCCPVYHADVHLVCAKNHLNRWWYIQQSGMPCLPSRMWPGGQHGQWHHQRNQARCHVRLELSLIVCYDLHGICQIIGRGSFIHVGAGPPPTPPTNQADALPTRLLKMISPKVRTGVLQTVLLELDSATWVVHASGPSLVSKFLIRKHESFTC